MSICRGMDKKPAKTATHEKRPPSAAAANPSQNKAKEVGGPDGPEPTRYGDWERGGRCVDF